MPGMWFKSLQVVYDFASQRFGDCNLGLACDAALSEPRHCTPTNIPIFRRRLFTRYQDAKSDRLQLSAFVSTTLFADKDTRRAADRRYVPCVNTLCTRARSACCVTERCAWHLGRMSSDREQGSWCQVQSPVAPGRRSEPC
eukprot:120802-Rhodomonas_salina.1